MNAPHVLVAYASQAGTTAELARVIASELRSLGIAVDSRPATEVGDVGPFTAVVLGSGVFLPRRASDGGGFLARHREALASRSVWLFCAGPIGRRRGADEGSGAGVTGDCAVTDVARQIGARGSAAFGCRTADAADPLPGLGPVDLDRVRWWARGIAIELTSGRRRRFGAGGLAAVI